jgi:hypothetical protein
MVRGIVLTIALVGTVAASDDANSKARLCERWQRAEKACGIAHPARAICSTLLKADQWLPMSVDEFRATLIATPDQIPFIIERWETMAEKYEREGNHASADYSRKKAIDARAAYQVQVCARNIFLGQEEPAP